MEQEVVHRRNVVFDRIYGRTLRFYMTCVPKVLQWCTELLLLFLGLCTLALWSYVHFTYILDAKDCLGHVSDRPFPYDVILQVEVYSNSSEVWIERQTALQKLYETLSNDDVIGLYQISNEKKSRSKPVEQHLIDVYCDNWIIHQTQLHAACDWIIRQILSSSSSLNDSYHEDYDSKVDESNNVDPGDSRDLSNDSYFDELRSLYSDRTDTVINKTMFFAEKRTLYDLIDVFKLRMLAFDYTILEFSQEPGYLSLSQSSRAKLNISVVKTYVDPYSMDCFGGEYGRLLTKYFLGYEMMVISSFKNLLPDGQGSGYVKNLLTGHQYYYKVQWMGKWRYGAGLLPVLFFTLVASVLLRQVHYHVFKFLTHFQHLLNQGVPIPIQTGAQIPFLVVTYAAIGLVIVMSEALNDDSVFSLLMIGTVWEVDQFYAIYCRCDASKMYFAWFFFLYHFLPYAYYIRFNGQFWFIPFLFHWLMIQVIIKANFKHAMLFFLHHCELPAMQHHGIRFHINRLRLPVEQLQNVQGLAQRQPVEPPDQPVGHNENYADQDSSGSEEDERYASVLPAQATDHGGSEIVTGSYGSNVHQQTLIAQPSTLVRRRGEGTNSDSVLEFENQ